MANISAKNAAGTTVEIKATGDGSSGAPYIPEHSISGIAALATVALQATAQSSLSSIVSSTALSATAGRQDAAQTSLTSIDAKLTALAVKASIGVVAAQSVAVSGTSALSGVWNGSTTRVVLCSSTDCWVAFGASPAAAASATNAIYVPAGVYGYPIMIAAGQRLAVIQSSAAGTLNIIEAA